MQALAALIGLVIVGVGFAYGGWRGALTGLVASIGVGSGLAILKAESGTGVDAHGTTERTAQRIGGLVAALGCLGGAWYGGWRSGWLWGLAGYLLGAAVSVAVGSILERRRSA